MSSVAAFLGIAALVIVTPGQDTALTIRNTLLGGRRAGSLTALGVAAGQAVWTVGAAAGVTAVLLASERVFALLKLAGAAYLVVLGTLTLVGALRDRQQAAPATAAPAAFRQGFLSNLGNPKMAVFFTSLLPQLAGGRGFGALLALGLVFCALTLVWLCAYALAVARARGLLTRAGARRALSAVTGAALVALGLRLAAAER